MAKIILFRGKAGVGKTTLSNHLSKYLSLTVIHKDDIYNAIAHITTSHQTRNEICDSVIKNIIKNVIENDNDIIIDSSYHYLNQIKAFREWVEFNGGNLKSILVVCSDEELWKNRFEKRRWTAKPNNIIVDFEELKKHYKTLHTQSITGELIVDTKEEMEAIKRKVVEWL